MSQLLTAPHIIQPETFSSWLVYNRSIEDVSSERFNIRDTDRGLNMDFMSYANFYLAGRNPSALLNSTALFEHSLNTFQTFFKHFAARGKFTYINGLRSAVWREYINAGGTDYPPERVNGTVTQRMEILTMNETATCISLAIIFLLIVILAILLFTLQIAYPRSCMQHPVECLADTLMIVAGSDEFVNLVHAQGVQGLEKIGMKTRLGWFRDRRGVVRWGIEVVDGDVEWVDGPDKEPFEEGDVQEVGETSVGLWQKIRARL
jgi:hypothetical protein